MIGPDLRADHHAPGGWQQRKVPFRSRSDDLSTRLQSSLSLSPGRLARAVDEDVQLAELTHVSWTALRPGRPGSTSGR